MRELSISLDHDAEISLRIFMERTRTADERDALHLALRSAALLIDRTWLSEVIERAIQHIPDEEPTPERSKPPTS